MTISFLELLRCVCVKCLEKGKVVWGAKEGKYAHVRIDGCMQIPDEEKRCDCAIFYFPNHFQKTVVFVVEVKGRNYDFRAVQEKFDNSIRRIESLEEVRDRCVAIPVLYAKRHPSGSRRAIPHYRVSSNKGRLTMVLLNHGDDICKCLKH